VSIVHELPQKTYRPKCAPNEKNVNISLIALEGCTELRNLFLRGLPNLVELDLSGCAIKALDLENYGGGCAAAQTALSSGL
jgi:hypothetical protein